jgi:hypothetical protein
MPARFMYPSARPMWRHNTVLIMLDKQELNSLFERIDDLKGRAESLRGYL